MKAEQTTGIIQQEMMDTAPGHTTSGDLQKKENSKVSLLIHPVKPFLFSKRSPPEGVWVQVLLTCHQSEFYKYAENNWTCLMWDGSLWKYPENSQQKTISKASLDLWKY